MRRDHKNLPGGRMLSHLRWRLLSTTSLVLALSSPAWAGEAFAPDHPAAGPAVSAINGKVGVFAGSLSDGHAAGVTGALTLPFENQFGFQIDGMIGSADHDSFFGLGAHLFWRDPSRALLGIYASHVSWETSKTFPAEDLDGGIYKIAGADVGKFGVEAELYLDRVSLEGLAAYQFGTDTGFAGKGTLAYYPLDDLRFDISVIHLAGRGTIGSAGAEWALPGGSGFSLFADASIDEDHDWRTLGGVKFHFGGGGKSLIQRHREDDPGVDLPDDLYLSIGNSHCPIGTRELSGFCDGVI